LATSPSAISVIVTSLVLAFSPVTRSQGSPDTPQSVAEAARNSREHKANSTKHPKVFTNEDLGVSDSRTLTLTFSLQSSSSYPAQAPNLPPDCDNFEFERLTRKLRAAQEELDQLRSQISVQPPVISDGDLDLQYFKPGFSGLYFGAPPLLDSEPPAPARVAAVELEERVASLQKALRTVCEPPEAARIQRRLDELEEELNLMQRAFALDQDTYYSKPDYAEDTAGKFLLEAEQQQIVSLQSEIDSLTDELAELVPPPFVH
jgi:hypothetical protein